MVNQIVNSLGFRHTAYTFGFESNVLSAGIDGSSVPRGALVSLLQKAVLFAEAEVFSLITEADLDTRFEKAIGSMSVIECSKLYFSIFRQPTLEHWSHMGLLPAGLPVPTGPPANSNKYNFIP